MNRRLSLLFACFLLLSACTSGPMQPAAPCAWSEKTLSVVERARTLDLVPVQQAVPGIWVELRYATPRNVTGASFYSPDLPCLLHRETALKLDNAQRFLARSGYQLKIWDAYRPAESHWLLWQKCGATGYVHEPGFEGRWSHHCYGRAVDVTLLDAQGRELPMPSDFDDFSEHAWAAYLNGNPTIGDRLRTLQFAMMRAGFTPLAREWWHFSDQSTPTIGSPISAHDLGL